MCPRLTCSAGDRQACGHVHPGGSMRKLIAALTVAGLGLTTFGALAPSTGAAPPPGTGVTAAPQTAAAARAPQPARGQAARAQGDGPRRGHRRRRPQPQERNGSTVVKVGETSERGRGARRAADRDQYVELENEGTDRVFTLLVEFGNQRHPDYPDQDTDPDTPGPGPVRRSAPQRDPEPEPRASTTPRMWQPDYSQQLLPEPVLRHRPRRRVAEDLLREAVLRPLLRRR